VEEPKEREHCGQGNDSASELPEAESDTEPTAKGAAGFAADFAVAGFAGAGLVEADCLAGAGRALLRPAGSELGDARVAAVPASTDMLLAAAEAEADELGGAAVANDRAFLFATVALSAPLEGPAACLRLPPLLVSLASSAAADLLDFFSQLLFLSIDTSIGTSSSLSTEGRAAAAAGGDGNETRG